MDISILFETVESLQFEVEMNIASGFDTFRKIVRSRKEFLQLRDMAESQEGANYLFSRITELCKEESDPNFEDTFDVALAVYLMVLDGCIGGHRICPEADTNMATLAIVIKERYDSMQYFWARHVIDSIQARHAPFDVKEQSK